MIEQSQAEELKKIAKQMVAPGKGILAADESSGTIEKRFNSINLPSTEANRQAYRQMLFTTPGMNEFISGVILFDETIRQRASDDHTFVTLLEKQGILPGIKVDMGTVPLAEGSPEKITKGLDGLSDRLKEYANFGAKFAKWRAVITIDEDIPTNACIQQNANDLASYALACQEAGIVPIVEPEVLMDGGHTKEKCEEVSEKTLQALFKALNEKGVLIEGVILKTNMVVPGKLSGQTATPAEVAEGTLRVFKKVLPDNLPGQAFLSGGQSEIQATENLNAMNQMTPLPWELSFSYGRALQESALKIWNGQAENVKAGQEAFYHRAKMNGLARYGKYSAEIEKTA